jgi:hypothetical protein
MAPRRQPRAGHHQYCCSLGTWRRARVCRGQHVVEPSASMVSDFGSAWIGGWPLAPRPPKQSEPALQSSSPSEPRCACRYPHLPDTRCPLGDGSLPATAYKLRSSRKALGRQAPCCPRREDRGYRNSDCTSSLIKDVAKYFIEGKERYGSILDAKIYISHTRYLKSRFVRLVPQHVDRTTWVSPVLVTPLSTVQRRSRLTEVTHRGMCSRQPRR